MWDNCFSYGKNNKLDFSSNNVTQIVGQNGHGKSSLILILQELLYGKNSKAIKKADIANRNTNDDSYSMQLSLEINNKEYVVKQRRTPTKVQLELIEDGIDISEHTTTNTYKKIEKLLGLSFEDFCQLCYQSTDSSLEFLRATDTARKKFLISLLGLESYTTIEAKVKSVFAEVSTEKTTIQSTINTIETWLDKLNTSLLEPMALKEVPNEPEEIREKLAELKILQKDNEKLRTSIETNNKNKLRLKQLEAILAKPPEDKQYFINNIMEEIVEVTADLKDAKKKSKELKDITDTCPTCKQKLPNVSMDAIFSALSIAEDTIERKTTYLNDLTVLLNKAKEHKELKDKYQAAEKERATLEINDNLPDVLTSSLEFEITNLTKELNSKLAWIKSVKEYNTGATIHNSKIESLTKQRNEYLEQINAEKEKLTVVADREARLSVLKQAFSTKGLIAYKIESMIKELELLINSYLTEFSAGRFTIEFSVSNDKLNIGLTDNGKEIGITALSSGELARVNTATLLAIRKLLNSLSSNKLNLLFLDEVLNVLDEEGKQKLIGLLNQEEDLNSFIVSHGWDHPLVSKLVIEKTNGISKITEEY